MVDKTDSNVVGKICGIVSIVLAFFRPLAGLIFGIIGLVQSSKNKYKKGKNLNIIGIVLSVVVLAVVIIAAYTNLLNLESFPTQ